MRDKYLYCYNLEQARFFKSVGVKEVDTDYSPINKKVYVKFERGDELEKAFQLWFEKCKTYRNIINN